MGLKELFTKTIEREVNKRERIIAKKDEALLEKDEALFEKDEALLEKDEALKKERESMVCRSFRNGIDIPMIVNITNLTIKEVNGILKKARLV